MDSIPVTQDYREDSAGVIGFIYPSSDIAKLMENGFIFEVAPQITTDGIDDEGNYINPKLVSISIITGTARKMNNEKET